jgi:hypothetical protein
MIIDKPAIVILTAFALFWGSAVAYVAHDQNKSPQEKAEEARAELTAKQADSLRGYTRAYERCTGERPGSAQRADCLWDAGQEYPSGRLQHMRATLLESAKAAGYDVEIVTRDP